MIRQPAVAALLAFSITGALPADAQGSGRSAGARPGARGPMAAMQVVVARNADSACEPSCPEWIAAQGTIDATTPSVFRRVLAKLGSRRLPVVINSLGGSVDESLAVGRLLRAKGLDVIVARTVIDPCGAGDAACRKLKAQGVHLATLVTRASHCASSCAFLLAGGAHRLVGPSALVGVHQLATFQTLTKVLRQYRVETRYSWGVPVGTRRTLISERKVSETTRPTATPHSAYDKVRKYFVEMGVGEGIMPLLMSAPHTGIHWLTPSELESTGMATARVTAETALLGATPPRMPSPRPAAPTAGTRQPPAPTDASDPAATADGPGPADAAAPAPAADP